MRTPVRTGKIWPHDLKGYLIPQTSEGTIFEFVLPDDGTTVYFPLFSSHERFTAFVQGVPGAKAKKVTSLFPLEDPKAFLEHLTSTQVVVLDPHAKGSRLAYNRLRKATSRPYVVQI